MKTKTKPQKSDITKTQRYYVADMGFITEQQKNEILAHNKRCFESDNLEDWMKVKFVLKA